ncbi:MAG: hypothetical protein OXP28_00475 [Gammaproteobacteria bacterium]|nr:hypothetical protein [Gammaproteobacteria bacterium]
MAAKLDVITRCRGWQPVARRALVAMACIALAGCGRGPGSSHPDLTVASPEVSDDRPAAAARFTFSATVHNAGRGNAAATTLRVYRSKDATVTRSDKEVGTAAVTELPASERVIVAVDLTAPSTSGTYYYGACVDAQDSESDTANNCSAPVRVTVRKGQASPLPDLVLGSPEVSDASPATGDGFTLSVRVRNAGSTTVVETSVRFHRSADQAITPSDPVAGTDTIEDLAVAGTRVASVDLTAPSSPGTYYYGACVNAVDGHSDTANHCSAPVRVTVREPQTTRPDLAVAHEVRTLNAVAGKYLRVSAEVYNAGGATAAATRAVFYRSTDSTITRSDKFMVAASVPELAPSRRVHVAGSTLAPKTPGTYYYGACVDAVAGESDTTNNCRGTLRATVRLGPPDLVVVAPSSADPARPAAGGRFSLRVAVYKIGGERGAVSLRCFRSGDAQFTSPGTQVGFKEVRDMAPFGVLSTSMHLDAPSNKGTYYFRVCADAVAGETDTTNNCSSPVKVVVSDDNRVG